MDVCGIIIIHRGGDIGNRLTLIFFSIKPSNLKRVFCPAPYDAPGHIEYCRI